MIYLIDGHNVIGQLPDISLDDPNDEAILVQKLVGFSARTRRRCVVVFDHGLPGGTSRMSTRDVQVVFASQRSTADRVMIERIGKIPDPVQWIVVSSDNDVLGAARGRKMQTLRSDAFVILLESPPAPDIDVGEDSNVDLSPAEVDEWLQFFGNENGQAPPTKSLSPVTNSTQKGKQDPSSAKSGKPGLSQRDMAEWTRFVNQEINPKKSGKSHKQKQDKHIPDLNQPVKQSAPRPVEPPKPASKPAKIETLQSTPPIPDPMPTMKADLSMIGGEQGEIAGKIFLRIGLHVEERNLGRVTAAGTAYAVANTLLDPDVGFVAMSRAPKGLPKGHIPFAPDLAVEIVSPDEKPRHVLDRIERYLENGTRLVWVIYPDERIVDVWRRSDRGGLNKQKVGIDGTLDGEDVLPGFKLAVRGIFPK